jgi:hypothetical protein
VKPEEAKRLAEAEARASRLAAENARLQEALARKEAPAPAEIKDAEAALAELRAGNLRFAEGRRVRTLLSSQDPGLRQSLAKGQAPFAVIVTCSDSRVMDNLLFDQELGRLFTIREAGNCPDIQGLASVEYAVEHLGSKLVVLLGHTSCGAVKAVQEAGGKPLPGNLWSLQAAMAGLLETTPEDPNEGSSEYLRHGQRPPPGPGPPGPQRDRAAPRGGREAEGGSGPLRSGERESPFPGAAKGREGWRKEVALTS